MGDKAKQEKAPSNSLPSACIKDGKEAGFGQPKRKGSVTKKGVVLAVDRKKRDKEVDLEDPLAPFLCDTGMDPNFSYFFLENNRNVKKA